MNFVFEISRLECSLFGANEIVQLPGKILYSVNSLKTLFTYALFNQVYSPQPGTKVLIFFAFNSFEHDISNSF